MKNQWNALPEGRNNFLSMLPALAVVVFFSLAFNISDEHKVEAPDTTIVLGVYDFEYINDSNCSFKLQVYQNGSACGTTVGTVAPGTGSINYSLPCQGGLTGVRLLGLSGAPDVPSGGDHPCSGDGGLHRRLWPNTFRLYLW